MRGGKTREAGETVMRASIDFEIMSGKIFRACKRRIPRCDLLGIPVPLLFHFPFHISGRVKSI